MNEHLLNYMPKSTSATDVYTNLHGLQSIKNQGDTDQALRKVAQQFESLFVSMMLKNMRAANSVFEKDSLFDSNESRFYRDLHDQQFALSLSHGRGLGIAEVLYRQLSWDHGTQASAGAGNDSRQMEARTLLSENGLVQGLEPPVASVDSLAKSSKIEDQRFSLADTPLEFVRKIAPHAKKYAEKLGLDHLLLVAQSALETGWGKYMLADRQGESSNNLFNIKRGSDWEKDTTEKVTVEYKNGLVTREKAEFRVYDNLEESFADYIDLVLGSERYQTAVKHSHDNLAYIHALQEAGYATDPSYAEKVMSVMGRVVNLVSEYSDTRGDSR